MRERGSWKVGVEGGRFSGDPVSGADSECNREVTGKEAASGGTGQPARFKTEGRPGTLLAKLSVVQDGRQADVCPVAWDIVWGFILLDFGCKKDIFYIEIIGFMVY